MSQRSAHEAARGRVAITGMGIICGIAADPLQFEQGLRAGRCGIGRLSGLTGSRLPTRVAAELQGFEWAPHLARLGERAAPERARAREVLRGSTLAVQVDVCAATDAFFAAGLEALPAPREQVGLIVAGNNLEQRAMHETASRYAAKAPFVSPRYALSFLDTQVVGAVSAVLSLQGPGFTVGGASASGGVGIANGFQLVRSGLAPVCLVLGAMMDLSELELQALAALGALSSDRFRDSPDAACRPFDRAHEGTVYGQASACLVLEDWAHAVGRGTPVLAELAGTAMGMDGHHLAEPNPEGEARVMRQALSQAGISAADVQYLNAHATSTPRGDEAECLAIRSVFEGSLDRLWVNSTKSLVGHTLAAAGVVEAVATVLQVNGGFIHPNRNLREPIDTGIRFAGSEAVPAQLTHAVSNSFGFGGINTSIVVRRVPREEGDLRT